MDFTYNFWSPGSGFGEKIMGNSTDAFFSANPVLYPAIFWVPVLTSSHIFLFLYQHLWSINRGTLLDQYIGDVQFSRLSMALQGSMCPIILKNTDSVVCSSHNAYRIDIIHVTYVLLR
jgi:hypothetical protein